MSKERNYRCIRQFYVPLCDEDGIQVESGEMVPVEVGETFCRSQVTWMNDVHLDGVGNHYTWLEIDEDTFNEYFEEVRA